MNTEDWKEKLLKERGDLELILKELNSEESAMKDIGSDMAPEISDLSDQYEEKQSIYSQKEVISQRLAKVVRALERLAAGVHGQCTKCGKEIEEMRLKIDPATETCRQCSL